MSTQPSITFGPDRQPSIDAAMEEVAKEAKAAGKPIRIRISPGLYRGDRRYYTAWHTLTWFLTFPGVEEARQFRVVFQKFFEIMATEGPEETQRRLETDFS